MNRKVMAVAILVIPPVLAQSVDDMLGNAIVHAYVFLLSLIAFAWSVVQIFDQPKDK